MIRKLKKLKYVPACLYVGMVLPLYLHTRLKSICPVIEADAKRMCDEMGMSY